MTEEDILATRDPDACSSDAMARATLVDDPGLGRVRVSTAEDLLLAKLEFADGDIGGLQGRDIVRLLEALWPRLDQTYVRRHALGLGVGALLDEAVARAGA